MPARVTLCGVDLTLDAAGVAWCAAHRALLAADLHLEKGSSFARTGQLLPPYDTFATVQRLAAAVARYQPDVVYLLGDSFHDPFAGERLPETAITALTALAHTTRLIWITGNHDPVVPAALPGARAGAAQLGPLTLRHIPSPGVARGEIAGHLHPVARIRTRAGVVRRACFISDAGRMILPAFGAYAGGLNVRDPAFAGLFERPMLHALGAQRVLPVGFDRALG